MAADAEQARSLKSCQSPVGATDTKRSRGGEGEGAARKAKAPKKEEGGTKQGRTKEQGSGKGGGVRGEGEAKRRWVRREDRDEGGGGTGRGGRIK